MNIKRIAVFLGPNIAQNTPATSIHGARPMDQTVKTMKDALEAIRALAANALSQIERPQEQYSIRWTCKGLRVCETFYEAHLIGSRWQTPSMREHGVQTDFVMASQPTNLRRNAAKPNKAKVSRETVAPPSGTAALPMLSTNLWPAPSSPHVQT